MTRAGDDTAGSTVPLRHYLEAKDSNGNWFVVSSWATAAEAAQAKLDYEASEGVPTRLAERPEGQETPEQDDTSKPEKVDDGDATDTRLPPPVVGEPDADEPAPPP